MWLRISLSADRRPLGVWERDCRFFLEEEWNSVMSDSVRGFDGERQSKAGKLNVRLCSGFN